MRVEKSSFKAVLFLIFILFIIIYGNIKIYKQTSLDYLNVRLQITNYTSAEMVNNIIFFYSVPGNTVKGQTFITNHESAPVTVKLVLEGELAEKELISLSESNFNLGVNETKAVEIAVKVPFDAEGNYSARLKVESW